MQNFKAAVKKQTGEDFPACPWDQLWGAVCAVFGSWMNERAILYRKLNNIPAEWGTAVTVQAMVFGNMGANSATGVAFSRDAATGENLFNGEYLINAQGEDVVAGIRTPQQITIEGSKRWAVAQNVSEEERRTKYPSLEEVMPTVYKELDEIQRHLEQYFKDMQDIEFTIQDGKLWMLQCRNGKRTGAAMVKIAMDMLREGLIDERTAVLRCEPAKLDELLHPVFDKKAHRQCAGHHQGSARIAGSRYGSGGVLRRRRREDPRRVGPESDPRPHRDFARGPQGHARRGRHPDRTRRHDVARGRRRTRHGQMLRIGRRRAGDRL